MNADTQAAINVREYRRKAERGNRMGWMWEAAHATADASTAEPVQPSRLGRVLAALHAAVLYPSVRLYPVARR